MTNTKCNKPDCDCLEIAIEKNGGTDVKSYPCLAGSNTPMPSEFKKEKEPSKMQAYINELVAENANLKECIKTMTAEFAIKMHDKQHEILTLQGTTGEQIGHMPIEERSIYITANPETESGTWYKDQAGNEFYLQKRESSLENLKAE